MALQKPEGYDESHYELHRRYIQAGGKLYTPRFRGIPNRKTDLIGSEAVLATDLLGMNDDWPTANRARRQEILEETTRFTKGLIWFFANDEAVPVGHLLDPSPSQPLTINHADVPPKRMVQVRLLPRRIPRQQPFPTPAVCPRRPPPGLRLHHHPTYSHGARWRGARPLPHRRCILAHRHALRTTSCSKRPSPQRGLRVQGEARVEAVWDFVSCPCSEGWGGCECSYGDLSEFESCWLWYVCIHSIHDSHF